MKGRWPKRPKGIVFSVRRCLFIRRRMSSRQKQKRKRVRTIKGHRRELRWKIIANKQCNKRKINRRSIKIVILL
jgi:hypothetical protein